MIIQFLYILIFIFSYVQYHSQPANQQIPNIQNDHSQKDPITTKEEPININKNNNMNKSNIKDEDEEPDFITSKNKNNDEDDDDKENEKSPKDGKDNANDNDDDDNIQDVLNDGSYDASNIIEVGEEEDNEGENERRKKGKKVI